MRLANLRNGIVYEHDNCCYFQSNHAHRMSTGYFKHDAMPYNAIIYLLKGGKITIIDATAKNKELTDALKFGVPTWCLVYNRALKIRGTKVCGWQTKEMEEIANGKVHRKYLGGIRRLSKLFPANEPAIIGNNISLECYKNVDFDDKPIKLLERRKQCAIF